MLQITFDQNVKDFILESFNKAVNHEGVIIEKNKPDQVVLAPDGQEVLYKDFAGIKKGSEIFIKSDLISLMKLCEAIK